MWFILGLIIGILLISTVVSLWTNKAEDKGASVKSVTEDEDVNLRWVGVKSGKVYTNYLKK